MGVHDGRHREEARPRADVAIRIEHWGYPFRLDCFGAVRLAMTDGEKNVSH